MYYHVLLLIRCIIFIYYVYFIFIDKNIPSKDLESGTLHALIQ